MARTRLLKPDFFKSEDISNLSPFARLLFQGLWCHADKDGRLLDRPRRLRLEILPYDDQDGESLLAELAANPGLIVRYVTADGQRCIQITNFSKHQSPHHKEPSLGLPGPSRDNVGQSHGLPGNAMESHVEFPSSLHPLPSFSSSSGSEGSLPPPAIPVAPSLTGPAVTQLFGRIRSEEYGGLQWQGAGPVKAENASRAADLINATVGGAATVSESLRRFWRAVKTGEHPAAQEIAAKGLAFAFACWAGQYPTDHEDITGVSPPKPPARSDRATGPPRDVTHGHARAEDSRHTRTGEVKL